MSFLHVDLALRDDPAYIATWWARFEAEESLCIEMGLPIPVAPAYAPGWPVEDADLPVAPLVALSAPALDVASMDEAQRRVVEHETGPALVMAGAGSGKTRTIVARVVRLLERGVAPSEILCLTFTRRAAEEMRARIAQRAGSAAKKITISTFHALSLDLLRSHPSAAERQNGFSVWDDDTQKKEIRALIKQHPLAIGVDRGEWVTAGDVCAALDTVKERGQPVPSPAFYLEMSLLHEQAWEVAIAYEQLKKDCNVLDFADLVWRVATGLLAPTGPASVAVRRRWTSVIVDEYQDTNAVQELLLERLAVDHRNLMAVGDEDQAIYAFRGSNVDYIRTFSARYDGAVTYLLGRNYRSTPEIVQSANALISQNKHRNYKAVWSESTPGAPIEIGTWATPQDEARVVAGQVVAARDEGVADEELAVLVRTRMQLIPLQFEMQRHKVPFYVVGDVAWYSRSDAKVVLAWMNGALNVHNVDAGATALASWDGIGSGTITIWRESMTRISDPMFSRLAFLHGRPGLGTHTRRGARLAAFAQAWLVWEDETRSGTRSLRSRIDQLITDLGIHKEIVEAKRSSKPTEVIDAHRREAFLLSLLQSMPEEPNSGGWKGMQHWLDELFVNVKLDQNQRTGVCLSTIHGSKGLEWERVWLPGWSMDVFPSERSSMGEQLEEERRLAYVAVTRARSRLTVSWFRTSFVPTPKDHARSPFLDELDPEGAQDARWTEAAPIALPVYAPTPAPSASAPAWTRPEWFVATTGEVSPPVVDDDQPQHPWDGWDQPVALTLAEVTLHAPEETLRCIACHRQLRVSVTFDAQSHILPKRFRLGRKCAARLLGYTGAVFDAMPAAVALDVTVSHRGEDTSPPADAGTSVAHSTPMGPSIPRGTQTSLFASPQKP